MNFFLNNSYVRSYTEELTVLCNYSTVISYIYMGDTGCGSWVVYEGMRGRLRCLAQLMECQTAVAEGFKYPKLEVI